MGTRYNQKIRLEKPEKEAFEETEMGKSLQQTIAEALARLQDEGWLSVGREELSSGIILRNHLEEL